MDAYYRRVGAFIDQLNALSVRETSQKFKVYWQPSGYKTGNEVPQDGWRAAETPLRWGGYEEHRWFRIELELEDKFIGRRVAVSPFPQDGYGEAMRAQYIAYLGGKTECGLDEFHRALEFVYEGPVCVDLYAYTGMSVREMLFSPWCAAVDEDARSLAFDLSVPYDVMGYSREDGTDYAVWKRILTDAVNALELTEPGSEEYRESLSRARDIVGAGYGGVCGGPTTVFIGHTHIDVAWLWTLAQTREKVQRTFSGMLRLMREYPEFKFMSSQPQLYEFFREEAPPELWEELKQRVREGRWEPEGAMWLEADCNLSSGESIVRQILYGKRYFREQFGKESKILWLPDAFGYTAALPQILRKCGIEWFVTSKISWNDTDRMPHDVFLWRGTDGSEIPAYFLTAQDKVRGREPERYTTYIGMAEPRQAAGTWERFQDKGITDAAINTYGYGDGGGGPTAEHIEKLRRMERGVRGCVRVKTQTVGEFLAHTAEKAAGKLPVWEGELYLEYHRGTYTSQAANKKNNRRAEFMMRSLELAATVARLKGGEYPRAELERLWKVILLNQFHDILPGSGIAEIYRDSAAQYAALFADGEKLFARLHADGGAAVFNPNGFPCSAEVRLADGTLAYVEDIPAAGWRRLKSAPACGAPGVCAEGRLLENKFFRIRFDENWEMDEIYDKRAERQLLVSGGKGNRLVVYDDHGNYEFDAWEIKKFYTEKQWPLVSAECAEWVEDGCRKGVRFRRRFNKSVFGQTVWLYENTPRIDVDNDFDVQDSRIFVKAEFPLDIRASEATFDIQYGSIRRPTHRNTSWDEARFESYAHKYADISEGDYGVSLLNDCKFGYDVHDGVMKLTLLKTAVEPDPHADIGGHTFRYALFPHMGPCGAETLRQAYIFNDPPKLLPVGGEESFSFVSCDSPAVMVETVKGAEDGNGFIVRAYECGNTRARAGFKFGFPLAGAWECDLLENDAAELPGEGCEVKVRFKPNEIKTLRIVPQGRKK